MFNAAAEIRLEDINPRGGSLITLAKAALDCALQPIVEAVSGNIYGYESLLRGHDKLGFDSPLSILDTFERSGELPTLERVLAPRALAKFTAVPDFSKRTLFLNLDHRLIAQGEKLLDDLLPFLEGNGIAPSSICFELSERYDNSSVPEFSALMSKFRRLGFKTAIDDFGTGIAEMKLLTEFDLDYLKIDRHLINGIESTPKKRHLTKTVVDMAHVLGLRVIAEGVETESEFIICRDLGVDLIQGWFVARPALSTGELKSSFPHLRDLGQNRRVRRSYDEVLIRQQVETLPTIGENEPIETLFDMFRRHPDQPFFAVLNANDEPRGIVQESRLKDYIYQPFGRDLLRNRDFTRDISPFIDPAPTIDIGADSNQLMAVFSSTQNAKCVILTENMRYAGIISAPSLVKIINEKQLRQAQDQNPLTGLPGNQAIHAFLEEIIIDGDSSRYLCYCDFDHFKPFNDFYGFQRGDEAIALFARLMKRYFFSSSIFLGHVGGDDFFIGSAGWSATEMETLLERLLGDFDDDIRQLYNEEDRSRGYMVSQDRHGEERRFELLRCSVAVLEIPPGRVLGDPSTLSSRIAGLKKRAKQDVRGLVFETL